jgi:TonB family protein
LEGHVTLQARVVEDGSVTDIEVKESTNPGHGFEEAAIDALKKWRYEPGTLNGKPTPIYFEVTIDFTYR